MTRSAQNGLRVAGVILAVLSIPLAWSYLRIGVEELAISGMPAGAVPDFSKSFANASGALHVTGLQGNLILGLKIPYWFIAALVCLTGILQLVANSEECRAPQAFMWTLSLVSLALTVAVVAIPLAFGKGYPEFGGFIVMLSALIMVLCMGIPSEDFTDTDSVDG